MRRQYIREIGKTDNGIVVVTTHLYDGRKIWPLDIELYQHGDSLPEGKQDPEFEKKTELIRSGWNMAHIQKRLGHADVQTTINTYVHLIGDDMLAEYEKYLQPTEEDEAYMLTLLAAALPDPSQQTQPSCHQVARGGS